MAVPNASEIQRTESAYEKHTQHDALSEVLETIPLKIDFVGQWELGAPWCIRIPEAAAVVCKVISGRCLVTADLHTDELTASSGDILLLSPGAEHHLRDMTHLPVSPITEWTGIQSAEDPLLLHHGSSASPTTIHAGLFHFDESQMHPFCWGLPPITHLSQNATVHSPQLLRLFQWFEEELSGGGQGRQIILKRLLEVAFIELARPHLHVGLSGDNTAGQLLHPDLGPALTLMHRQPEKAWTVAELAEQVAMSRSAFAAMFSQEMGSPPMQYLRRQRMILASELLRNPSIGLKEIAMRVGYDSVSAFNSAFKQWQGIAPGQFRKTIVP